MPQPSTAPFPTGWLDVPERHVIAAQYSALSALAPHLYAAAPTGDILLYKAWKDVLGDYPKYVAQAIGDCTSWGAGHAVDLLEAVQIVIGKKAEAWKESCTEALYGAGREIANMLGGGDGCFGGALAKAVSQVGDIARDDVGPYSGQRAKEWGRTGTPAAVKAKMKDHLVKDVALVKTFDELRAALGNGYPVTVASDQGFQMTRNDKGICEAHGSWSHQMMICGILYTGTSDECAVIANSWGDEAFSGPTPNDIPKFAFGARRRVVEGMLGGGDSWAFSNFNGFPGQPLPSHWTYQDYI